jgi:dimeric dUTPase (all-alpha-NTP-PPase superfamily)
MEKKIKSQHLSLKTEYTVQKDKVPGTRYREEFCNTLNYSRNNRLDYSHLLSSGMPKSAVRTDGIVEAFRYFYIGPRDFFYDHLRDSISPMYGERLLP